MSPVSTHRHDDAGRGERIGKRGQIGDMRKGGETERGTGGLGLSSFDEANGSSTQHDLSI